MSKRKKKKKTNINKPLLETKQNQEKLSHLPNKNKWDPLIILLFVVIGFIIYSNTFHSPFVLDDPENIVDNPYIRMREISVDSFKQIFKGKLSSSRPLPMISFALNHYFGRYNVRGYHIVNILIHIVTGILLFLFLRKTYFLSNAPPSDSSPIKKGYNLIPFLAAFLWFVHPLCTQSVTYISQRMNGMTSIFYLLSLLFYIKGRQNSKIPFLWFLGCAILWIFALLSKEIAAILPFMIFLYEWFFFQNLSGQWLKNKIKWIIGVILLFAVFTVSRLGLNPFARVVGVEATGFTLVQRILTEFRVMENYLSLILYPHPSRLNFDYNFTFSSSLINPWTTLISFLIIMVVIYAAFRLAKNQRLLSFCLCWLIGNFMIEFISTPLFFPQETIFEHRTYLPSMLVGLFAIIFLLKIIKQVNFTAIIYCAIIIIFSIWTFQRNAVYKDEISLWTDAVKKAPKARSHNNLGMALIESGRLKESIPHYLAALQFDPDYAEAHNNLGNAYAGEDKFEEAIKHYYEAIRNDPNFAEAHNNLATAYEEQGELKLAVKHYAEALRINPYLSEASYNWGKALMNKGNVEEAITHFLDAIEQNPDLVINYFNLGNVYLGQGQVKSAIKQYNQVLRLQPQHAQAHNNLGKILTDLGKFTEAESHYTEALKINPNLAQTHNNLGHALFRQNKLERASKSFIEALRLNPNLDAAHINYGNTLKQQEKFKEAIDQYRESLRINPRNADVLFDLGRALEGINKVSEAIDAYKESLMINPDYSDGYNNLGVALMRLHKVDEAIEHYETAILKKPDSIEAYYNLGNAYLSQEKYEEAIKRYKETLFLNPNFVNAHINLGIVFLSQEKLDESVKHFTEAIRIDPNHADAYNNLGYVLMNQGNFEQAIENFQQTLRLNPQDANAKENLKKVQKLLKNIELK